MRTEPIEYEPNTDLEDGDIREVRWAEFVEQVREYQRGLRWRAVVADVADAMYDYRQSTFTHDCAAFAETEGWHGVLSAIARAMRDEERSRRELMDRR